MCQASNSWLLVRRTARNLEFWRGKGAMFGWKMIVKEQGKEWKWGIIVRMENKTRNHFDRQD